VGWDESSAQARGTPWEWLGWRFFPSCGVGTFPCGPPYPYIIIVLQKMGLSFI
jgi:hypothetical protein